MVDEGKLSQVLCDLARTMITESPMQGIADRLVKCIVEVLPVTSAGVTLITPETGSRYVAASDEFSVALRAAPGRDRGRTVSRGPRDGRGRQCCGSAR